MRKLELKTSSAIVAGDCAGLLRRIDAQIAKGTERNLRRAERMIERYERDCL
tara:strand:+ start:53 stop:208 length:156 start_codon:yes stop_codon:yes gene_type:complete